MKVFSKKLDYELFIEELERMNQKNLYSLMHKKIWKNKKLKVIKEIINKFSKYLEEIKHELFLKFLLRIL